MSAKVARVSYIYNSDLEKQGEDAYFLDVYAYMNDKTIVDVHQTYKTRAEFMEKINELIPVLETEDVVGGA